MTSIPLLLPELNENQLKRLRYMMEELIGSYEGVALWPKSLKTKKTIANHDRKVRDKLRQEQIERLDILFGGKT